MDYSNEVVLDFSPQRTATHFLSIFKNNIESLNYGFRLMDHSAKPPERFKDEELDFLHIQYGEPLSEKSLKENLKRTLLAKCFEDLIKGINLCLYDGYTLITVRKQLFENGINSIQNLTEFNDKTYKRAQSTPLPKLIKKIEEVLNSSFKLKEELLSINKVRACLTHRDGIVYAEKDINPYSGTLELLWIKPTMYQIANGKRIEQEKKFSVTHETPAFLSIIKVFKKFKVSTRVKIEYKEILEISYTLYKFVQHFVEMQIEYLKETKRKMEIKTE